MFIPQAVTQQRVPMHSLTLLHKSDNKLRKEAFHLIREAPVAVDTSYDGNQGTSFIRILK